MFRGRASVLLSEGQWFTSHGLLVKVSLCKILNPKLFLMCWSAACMAAATISIWMYVWITLSCFGQKSLTNAMIINQSDGYYIVTKDWFDYLSLLIIIITSLLNWAHSQYLTWACNWLMINVRRANINTSGAWRETELSFELNNHIQT